MVINNIIAILENEINVIMKKSKNTDSSNYLLDLVMAFLNHAESLIVHLEKENSKISNITIKPKFGIDEFIDAIQFLASFSFHPFAAQSWPIESILQIKIYSLKAYIEKLPLEKEIMSFFNVLFKKILPQFPKNIKAEDLGSLQLHSVDGDYWYRSYIYEQHEKNILNKFRSEIDGIDGENYQQKTSILLDSIDNGLEKFIVINNIWSERLYIDSFSDKSIVDKFFKILGNYAKFGSAAAALWIISAAQHGIFLIDEEKLNSCYAQFSLNELFEFIILSTQLEMNVFDYAYSFHKKLLEFAVKNSNTSDMEEFAKKFKQTGENIKFSLTDMQGCFLESEIIQNSKLFKEFELEFIKSFQFIITDINRNPIIRNSVIVPEKYTKLIKDYAEIRKSSRILAQGSKKSIFSVIPDDCLIKISSFTGREVIHEIDAEKIARQFFNKPKV